MTIARAGETGMPMNRPATLAAMAGAGVAGAVGTGAIALATKAPARVALGSAAVVGLASAITMFPAGIPLSNPDLSTGQRIGGTLAVSAFFGTLAGLGASIVLPKASTVATMGGVGAGVAAATAAAGLITAAVTSR